MKGHLPHRNHKNTVQTQSSLHFKKVYVPKKLKKSIEILFFKPRLGCQHQRARPPLHRGQPQAKKLTFAHTLLSAPGEKNHPQVLHQEIFVPKLVPIVRYLNIKTMTTHLALHTQNCRKITRSQKYKLPQDGAPTLTQCFYI